MSIRKIKSVIIDDQTVLRQPLVAVLGKDSRFEVVGQSGDGKEALMLCKKVKPDFVVLDAYLPSLHGAELVPKLLEILPQLQVLMITALPDIGMVRRMLNGGVHGIVEKNAPLKVLQEAVLTVATGGLFFGPTIEKMIPEARRLSEGEGVLSLSPRERETLQLIAEGYSTKQIADRLQISVKTAENHRTHLMQKLKIHDVATLTRFAIREGMIHVR